MNDEIVLHRIIDSLKNAGWKWSCLDTLLEINKFYFENKDAFGR
jgi:hypothetical protein